MGRNAAQQKMELKKDLTGEWEVGLMETPMKYPMICCPVFVTFPCCGAAFFACQQRKKILELTGEPYICCGNGLCGFFKTEKNPKDAEMDMLIESCCCTLMAVQTNRFYIQTRFNKKDTECDERLMCIEECLWTFACVLRLLNVIDDMCGLGLIPNDIVSAIGCIADNLTCSVFSCMLTQQHVALEEISKQRGGGSQMTAPGQMTMGRPM
jgi:hypothetical protein